MEGIAQAVQSVCWLGNRPYGETTCSERAKARSKSTKGACSTLTAIRNLGLSGMGCSVRPQEKLRVSTGCCLDQRQTVCLALQHGQAVHVRTDASLSKQTKSKCWNANELVQQVKIAAHLWLQEVGTRCAILIRPLRH